MQKQTQHKENTILHKHIFIIRRTAFSTIVIVVFALAIPRPAKSIPNLPGQTESSNVACPQCFRNLSISQKHDYPLKAVAIIGFDTSDDFFSYQLVVPIAVSPNMANTTYSDVFLSASNPLLTPLEMIGGGIVVTYGLFETDNEVYKYLRGIRMRSSVLSKVSPLVTNMGLGTSSLTLFSSFYVFHFVTGDISSMRAANIGMESFLLSGVVTQVIKNVSGRERPSIAMTEGGMWSGPLSYFKRRDHGSKSIASYDSFPSGHTATIFAAAASVADTYSEKWVSYVAYGTAALVGISRVTENAHWPSDVFIGAIVGIGSTKIVENLPFNRENSTLKFSLYSSLSGVGLSLEF